MLVEHLFQPAFHSNQTTSNLARMVNAESKPHLSSCMECCTNDVMQNTMTVLCPHIMSSEEEPIVKIDCDPAAFSVILNYLRHGVIAIPPYLPSGVYIGVFQM